MVLVLQEPTFLNLIDVVAPDFTSGLKTKSKAKSKYAPAFQKLTRISFTYTHLKFTCFRLSAFRLPGFGLSA
ncbi:hypothetical protein BCL90_4530 [Pedobacter alluvionis]|uniref:Uncharacterized protein n=1 Tax=Pedobacter alluvionis TaxID=475253 RepID=A0A497XU52_9SPHI|nr:hypothetical protein BCL90_4530 [Pedobacter alluvionis]